MDRRSWLWRRKSSEKSPSGETESSGSLSSHSERFSDDQALSNHNIQSPEVTSKGVPGDEAHTDSLKTLSEKLSEALHDLRAKEDLVKQHAKVAEEAVTGWERAENEVLILKKQADALTQKNLILEERVGHLDGALKECLRQLRQAREDQEEKIYDAVVKKSREWEKTKSELENQLAELQSQLQNAKTDAINSKLIDACSKLEAAAKENSILKLKLLSKAEELELRTCERDLSTHAAESASKQHLDSIKKVAKLEAECRRLKSVARKAALANDHRSITASSVYAESLTDGQSDGGERTLVIENDSSRMGELELIEGESCHPESWASTTGTDMGQSKNEKALGRSLIIPPVEIDLMDDFLEMERIVALPMTQSGSDPAAGVNGREDCLRDELEAMIVRASKLEENLEKMESDKINLEKALNECRIQLKTSEDQLKQTEAKLTGVNGREDCLRDELEAMIVRASELEENLEKMESDKINLEKALNKCRIQLKTSEDQLKQTEAKLVDLSTQLAMANEAKTAEQKEVAFTKEKLKNSTKLLDEAKLNLVQIQKQLNESNEAKSIVMVELENAYIKKAEAESQLKVVELELEASRSSICVLEKEINKERSFSREAASNLEKLESEISRMKLDSKSQRLAIFEEFRINQDKELALAASKFAECQKTIASLDRQLKSLATLEDFPIDSEDQ